MARFLGRIIIGVLLVWIGGFAVFMATLPRAEAEARIPPALGGAEDTGIVALTGGGLSRIREAIALMEDGSGHKVLITGTNPATRKEELASFIDNSDALFDCCVDLGPRALTTKGNAIETRDWVRKNGFSRIIVVTTDYHMPRALAEIRRSMPDTALVAWPVASIVAPQEGWMVSPEAWQVLVIEYNKFLLVRAAQLAGLE